MVRFKSNHINYNPRLIFCNNNSVLPVNHCNVFFSPSQDQSDNKSTKSDSASSSIGDGSSVNGRKPASNQNSTGAASTLSREAAVAALAAGSSGAQTLMVLNNKYSGMDPSASTLSSSNAGGIGNEDPHGNSNQNQNNNQGNVRQGGGEVVAALPPFIGGPLHINTLSSSEPSAFPSTHPLAAAAASPFSSLGSLEQQQRMLSDQLVMQQIHRQLQQQQAVAAQTAGYAAGLPPLLTNTATAGTAQHNLLGSNTLADDYLRDLATRARTDSLPSSSGLFLSNSPGTSKMSEASQDNHQVLTPHNMITSTSGDYRGLSDGELLMQQQAHIEQGRPSSLMMKSEPTSEDHEVSMINLPRPEDSDHFLAQRKRHASAPENLPDSQTWQRQQQRMGKISLQLTTLYTLSSSVNLDIIALDDTMVVILAKCRL